MNQKIKKVLDYPELERVIQGALREAIRAHGPITHKFIGSATKRATSSAMALLMDRMRDEAVDQAIQMQIAEQLEKKDKTIEALKNRIDYLMRNC